MAVSDAAAAKVPIDVYDGDVGKFADWKTKAIGDLTYGCDLEDLLIPGAIRPTDATQPGAQATWDRKSKLLFYKLFGATSKTARDIIKRYSTADGRGNGAAAWKELVEYGERKDGGRIQDLHQIVMHTHLQNGQHPSAHFSKVDVAARQLKDLGMEISEEQLLTNAKFNLPSFYNTLRVVLDNTAGLTYDQFKSAVRDMYQTHGGETKSDNEALLAQEKEKAYATLYVDGKYQHACGICGKKHPTHEHKTFPSKGERGGGSRGGRGNRGGRGGGKGGRGGRGGKGKDMSKIECFGCGEMGHYRSGCPKLKGGEEYAAVAVAPLALSATNFRNEHQRGMVLIDTACTSHMFQTMDGVFNFRSKKGTVDVGGKGNSVPSIGVGDLKVQVTTDDGRFTTLVLNGVLIVPKLGFNLFSGPSFAKQKGKVLVDGLDDEYYLEAGPRGSRVKIPFKLRGDLFIAFMMPMVSAKPTALGAKASSSPSPGVMKLTRLWHDRFAHADIAYLKKVPRGLGVPRDLCLDGKCEDCSLCKHTKRPFKKVGTVRTDEPLAVVHTDIVGPISVQSTGGSVYAVMFTDEATRYRWIKFMRYKSEVLVKFKEFISELARSTNGKKIKRIHSDNAKEFTSKEWMAFCTLEGITATTTGNYAPQQNGIAERGFRTIVSKAACLLHAAGASKVIWPDAMAHVVYVNNRTPCRSIGWKTPYSLFWGTEANVSNLRVWGCAAFVHKPPGQAKKLDPPSWKGVLVGNVLGDDKNRTCYRVYDPVNDLVKTEVHVTFDETVMPLKQQPTVTTDIDYAYDDDSDGESQATGEASVASDSEGDNDNDDDDDDDDEDSVGDERAPPAPTVPASIRGRRVIKTTFCQLTECKTKGPHTHEEDRTPKPRVSKAKARVTFDRAFVAVEERGDALDRAFVTIVERDSDESYQSRLDDFLEAMEKSNAIEDANPVGFAAFMAKLDAIKTDSADRYARELDRVLGKRANQHLAFAAAMEIDANGEEEPKTFKQATGPSYGDMWWDSMEREFNSQEENKTWDLVVAPRGANVLESMWVYKIKKGSQGQAINHKSRFVVKGCSQKEGIDYNETFAPVAMSPTIRLLLALAAAEDWELHNMDVDVAFLNSDVDEVIYVKQPEGFEKFGPNGETLVCRLNKSVYGLKQAPRNWNQVIDQWLRQNGLEPSTSDPCLYVSHDGNLMIALYVDDLLIAGKNPDVIKRFKKAIQERFKMKDLGELRWMLGMEVIRNRRKRTIEINQTAYMQSVLERFGMENCKAVSTPMVGALSRSTEEKKGFDTEYAKLVGSVLYLAMITRPDISYAVQSLSRHMNATTADHWRAGKHLLRYLQGTKHLGITFGGPRASATKLIGYCDADWANDKETRRSTTGYLFMLNGGSVSWGSKLQPTVALSSTEAEYMALCSGAQEAIYLRRLMGDLGYVQQDGTLIYEDNQGCIALTENPVQHKRSKHIDIKHHFTREKVVSGEIRLQYIPTQDQLADLLTKPLERVRVEALRNRVLGHKK